MHAKSCLRYLTNLTTHLQQPSKYSPITVSLQFYCSKTENHQPKKLIPLKSFENNTTKTKNTYLEMVNMFTTRDIHRRGHVEFIYSALKHMKTYGVQKDLEVYKALVDILPKGKFIPQNIFQSEFMHYPKQQQCIIDVLEQMEDNGVMPDSELEDILMNIFGRRGYPLRKFWRMMYWMPKFKNASPWPLPDPTPNDALELALLAIERISCADLQFVVTIYETSGINDSIDDTWIVSSTSPTQQELLKKHDLKEPIHVEGPFRVWLRDKSVNYFILRTKRKPKPVSEVEDKDVVSRIKVPLFNVFSKKTSGVDNNVLSVHEQEDGVIYGVCATGTSSRDSLLSWLRYLEKDNPRLVACSIVFSLRSSEKEIVATINDCAQNKKI